MSLNFIQLLYNHNEERTTTRLYKNIYVFLFFRKESNLWSVCMRERERQTDRRRQGDKDRLLYWPITSFLDRTTLLPSNSHLTLLLLGRGRSPWLQAGSDSRLILTPTDSDCHADIYIYHFIKPTISARPRDCFRLFTLVHPVQRNLRLTSLTRVNMQHNGLSTTEGSFNARKG